METVVIVVHVLLSMGLIGLVLMQHGKGADAGAAFGSGASGTVFGAQGAGNFLSRTTAILATLFFITSLTMAGFAIQRGEEEGLITGKDVPKEAPKPATPVAPATDLPPGAATPAPTAGGDLPPSAGPAPAPASDLPPVATPPSAGSDLPPVSLSVPPASDAPVIAPSFSGADADTGAAPAPAEKKE